MLDEADLSGAMLVETVLSGAKLYNTLFTEARRCPEKVAREIDRRVEEFTEPSAAVPRVTARDRSGIGDAIRDRQEA